MCYLYLLDQTSTSAYLSHSRGCDDELHSFQSFPSEWLVVTSLNIFKDNAFHNPFHLNPSIIMIEGSAKLHPGRNSSFFKPMCCFRIICKQQYHLDPQLCKEVDRSGLSFFFFFFAFPRETSLFLLRKASFFSFSSFLSFTAVRSWFLLLRWILMEKKPSIQGGGQLKRRS